MRLFKCMCLVVALMPLTVVTVGCGGAETDVMATDDELTKYGEETAPQAFKDAFNKEKEKTQQ